MILACYAQRKLARTLAADLRLPWQRPAPPGRLTRPGSAADSATSARQQDAPPVHQNPASRGPGARQGHTTAAPHPATTSGRPPGGNSASKPSENEQVKRQA